MKWNCIFNSICYFTSPVQWQPHLIKLTKMIAERMVFRVTLFQIVLKQNKTCPSDGNLSTVLFVR